MELGSGWTDDEHAAGSVVVVSSCGKDKIDLHVFSSFPFPTPFPFC